ncbi:MAG: N-dimethylarginine dimethylaminohydrolase [Intrasporangiaceae bacterium]|nr:N-dimethylarginine dimethylaminohydrolase [Intrasporangiaceae bacterium]
MTVLPFVRPARPRRYLLCPPEHFEVTYAINPWMDPTVPIDRGRAMAQWHGLRETYLQLGHEVVTVTAAVGLPDMVFAANGGVVVDGMAIGASFAHPERMPEADLYRDHLVAAGFPIVHSTTFANEGEGDLLVIGDAILAGTGFRTDPRSHAEVSRLTDREVVTLRLIDPRFYHLDTALAVLGLNAVSDGRTVVLAAEAEGLATALVERGFVPVPVELSELRKSGGGPKCCTLELRPARTGSLQEVSA